MRFSNTASLISLSYFLVAVSFQLDFVHGYRAHDARNNAYYLETGDLVFHAAAVGIVQKQGEEQITQRYVRK